MGGKLRIIGWVVFGIAAVVAGIYFYMRGVEQQVWWNVRQLGHRNAHIAYDAYGNLHNLYYSKWAALDPVHEAVHDTRPLNLLIVYKQMYAPDTPNLKIMGFGAEKLPIYYKSDRVYCRTVGEAVMAIIYNDRAQGGKPKWRTDFNGDWTAWWNANKGYYGVLD